MKTQNFLFIVLLLFACSSGYAQDSTQNELNKKFLSYAPGSSKLFLTGHTWFGFSANNKAGAKTNFNDYGFSPMLIWKLSDKILFEGEIEINNNAFELEFAKLYFVVNKYLTIGAGRMLTPFGAYGERWEAAVSEKFPNSPVRSSGDYLPSSNHLTWGAIMGVDFRGAIPLGSAKMNYTLFVSNGSVLNTDASMAGMIDYENLDDNNSNKEIGGRIGFLPLSNSSLEIGFSAKSGKVANASDVVYKNIGATAYAIDWNYLKAISELKGVIGLRGQYTTLTVDKANYLDASGATYTFDNTLKNNFIQFSYRPSMSGSAFLKKIEFLYRYNTLTAPKNALWGAKDASGNGGTISRSDLGLDYWFSWKTGLRIAYETTKMPDGTKNNEFLVKIQTGF